MNDESFENIETQYSTDIANRGAFTNKLHGRKSMPNLAPQAGSSISSGTTATPRDSENIFWANDNGMNNFDHYAGEKNANYQDFRSKQDYFDRQIQRHRDDRSPTKRSNDFAYLFNNPHNERQYPRLKHPSSMYELKPRKESNIKPRSSTLPHKGQLKNIVSYGNLKPSLRSNSVRFKSPVAHQNSVPSPIKENEMSYNNRYEDDIDDGDDEEDYELHDTVIIANKDFQGKNNDNFLNKFSEEKEPIEDYGVDNDFVLDNAAIQTQFLSQSSDINHGRPLMSHNNDISSNKYRNSNQISRKWSGKLKGSPVSRIQTIKQTIDYNIPNLGNGDDDKDIFYDPASQKWKRTNSDMISNFQRMDINDDRQIKTQERTQKQQIYNLENIKQRSNSRNPKVSGNMVLNEKDQRWVSISGDDPDPFAQIDDFPITSQNTDDQSPFIRPKSAYEEILSRRASSHNLRKYNSMGKNLPRSNRQLSEVETKYIVDSHDLEKFYHEENKWRKLVGGWFVIGADESSFINANPFQKNVSLTSKDNKDFMYEIRKMVLNSTRH